MSNRNDVTGLALLARNLGPERLTPENDPERPGARSTNAVGSRAPPLPPRLAYSIREFCSAVGISEAYYFELKRERRGPQEIALGTRRLISVDEARRWCAELTAANNPKDD